jgi:fumarate hydratase class II
MAYNLLQSIHLLSRAVTVFGEKCIKGISANSEKCTSNLEQSLALVTALVPAIGYDKAAALAKEAYESGKTVREVACKARILPESEINKILDEIVGSKGKA